MDLPNFSNSNIPSIRIKSMRFENYKVFDNFKIDFTDKNGSIQNFMCFHGPNGSGKSTVLNGIQLVFSRFDGWDKNRLMAHLGRSVRHIDAKTDAIYASNLDFQIEAEIECSLGDYTVVINKNGFQKDHPQEIKDTLMRILFYTRFDMELDKFQLERNKWQTFQKLFNAVTGYEIEETKNLFFKESEDPVQAEIMEKYILSFIVKKDNEIIKHTECSAGEKKTIKSFSTLLNKEYTPQIILVDNIEMHVELSRHLELINSMKECFPKSQIFAATHSYYISRNFNDRTQLFDMRLIHSHQIIKDEPWRLVLFDEIKDEIAKIKAIKDNNSQLEVVGLLLEGKSLQEKCLCHKEIFSKKQLINKYLSFANKVAGLFADDIVNYYRL